MPRYINRYGVITVISYGEPLFDADESIFDGYED